MNVPWTLVVGRMWNSLVVVAEVKTEFESPYAWILRVPCWLVGFTPPHWAITLHYTFMLGQTALNPLKVV